jgi:type VI protein secretion system component Hcp
MDIVVEMEFADDSRLSIEAQSCSWGIALSGSAGTPQGPAMPQDFVFTAASSRDTTPQLKSACESGAAITRVRVTMIETDSGTGLEWVFDSAFVSSLQTSGATAETFGIDSVSVNFQTVTVGPF